MEDELLDLVNAQDEVIGTILRSQAYAEKRLYQLRAVWLVIKNEDGKFWIPKRSATKKNSPNYLDGSTVGHVSSGETYEQSMIREVAEELQFDISAMPYRLVGKLTPAIGSVSFVEVFELCVPNDFVINYNQQDFSEFFWLSAQEIVNLYQQGQKMRTTLVSIMKNFYGAHE